MPDRRAIPSPFSPRQPSQADCLGKIDESTTPDEHQLSPFSRLWRSLFRPFHLIWKGFFFSVWTSRFGHRIFNHPIDVCIDFAKPARDVSFLIEECLICPFLFLLGPRWTRVQNLAQTRFASDGGGGFGNFNAAIFVAVNFKFNSSKHSIGVTFRAWLRGGDPVVYLKWLVDRQRLPLRRM
jgi:hypothetical protein